MKSTGDQLEEWNGSGGFQDSEQKHTFHVVGNDISCKTTRPPKKIN